MESLIDAFPDLKAQFLVQDFIAEADGRDVGCLVISDKVVAEIERQAKAGALIMEVNASPGLEGIETASDLDIDTLMIACIEACLAARPCR